MDSHLGIIGISMPIICSTFSSIKLILFISFSFPFILRSLFFNPRDAIFLYSEIMNIMARTLEIAGVKNTGLLGHLRKKALVAIYLSTLRVWISDDSPDCARTMSFLDKRLQDAEALEGVVQKCERFSRVSKQEV